MSDAVEIGVDEIFTKELQEVMAIDDADKIYAVPIDGHHVLARIRPGSNPHLFATSCDVLTRVDLPDGWDGSCLERTVNRQRESGVFQYGDVSA